MLDKILKPFLENPILVVQFLYVALTLAIILKSDPIKLDDQSDEAVPENCDIPMVLWSLSAVLVMATLLTWVLMLTNGSDAQVPLLNMSAKKVAPVLLIFGIIVNALSTDPLGFGVRKALGADDEYSCGSIDGVQSFVLGGVALALCGALVLGRKVPGFESRLSYA